MLGRDSNRKKIRIRKALKASQEAEILENSEA
jgi:hypothetical protein